MRLKVWIKICFYRFWPLRQIFILWYKMTGQKPWGRGYSVFKSTEIQKNITNGTSTIYFTKNKFPLGYGYGLDERVVEYPWFFAQLKDSEKMILDAGSSLNHYAILNLPQIKKRVVHLITLANEGRFRGKHLHYLYGDLRQLPYKDGFFDGVVSISTIEHVGLDNTFLYTQDKRKRETDTEGYAEAIRELKRVLKPGGTLYLTVPYGRYQNHGWFQVFDGDMIDKIILVFSPAAYQETYFRYVNRQWNFSDRSACNASIYFDIHKTKALRKDHLAASESVACLLMTK